MDTNSFFGRIAERRSSWFTSCVTMDGNRREALPLAEEYALRRKLRDTLTGLIRTGQGAGIFRAGDPDALATVVLAMLDPTLASAATHADLKHRQRMSG